MLTLHHPIALTPTVRPARRLRIAAALVAASIGTLAGALVAPASGAAAMLTARSAAAFRDSIGVQTHFGFAGYAYDTATTDELASMLRTLGIRHLRDDLCLNTEQACVRVRGRLAAMQHALGDGAPNVDLLAGYTRELASAPDRATRDSDIERALAAATTAPLASMVAALEPVNEPDLKQTAGWESATLADDDTFRRLLAEPRFAALRGVPQLSPAIGHADNTAALLAAGWSGARADIGNFHPYPPAWGGPENGLTVACGEDTVLGCARKLGGATEPIASESGYTTAGTVLSTSWVSERAQSIYLPRLLLENFRAGVARTYLYELIDLRPSRSAAVEGYGLWRSKSSGASIVPADPKPAALAVSRMNATIGDLGTGGEAKALDVTVAAGGHAVGDEVVRRVLLARADGSYVLALWQPQAVWSNAIFRQRDLTVSDLPIEVTIGGATWTASATRPSLGDGPTGSWQRTQRLSLPVGADVTLVELRADGSAPDGMTIDPAQAAGGAAATAGANNATGSSATTGSAEATQQAWQAVAKRGALALVQARRSTAARADR
ncbi:MAG: hypothetical protein QM679_10560 [Patulibacter sp.]